MILSQLHPLRLKADPARVVLRPFHLAWQGTAAAPGRAERLVDAVLALDDKEIERQLRDVMRDFESRHWQARAMFLRRFRQICELLDLGLGHLGDQRKQLIGAYFCHEYSYAAAALMNPSIVPHPDQSGLDKQHAAASSCRCARSAKATSARSPFAKAWCRATAAFELAPEPPFATAADAPDIDGLYEDGPIDGAARRQQQSVGHGDLPGHPGAGRRARGSAPHPLHPRRRATRIYRHLHRLFGARHPLRTAAHARFPPLPT